jgi:sulfide:quinone oxidoreductase
VTSPDAVAVAGGEDCGMTEFPAVTPLRVVVVGGGIAALETVLALHHLADGLRVTVIAPEPDFVLRPLAVAAPFSRGRIDRLPLAEVMAEHGGQLVRGTVFDVDTNARTVTLNTGDELAYDVLVLALGAIAVPAFEHALTFGAHGQDLVGVIADLEEGYSRSVAFVAPAGCGWTLPLYELALMTARDVWAMNMDRVEVHLVTPELAPLEVFGAEASAVMAELLDVARITMHFDASARVHQTGRIETGSGADLVVDRVVALPMLEGPNIAGVPSGVDGFIPVDARGLVDGLGDVYAVGDATDRPIKQGGLACQQADVTAAHIAARAGADVDVPALEQVLRGRLLTGTRDHILRAEPGAKDGTATHQPLWWTPTKVSGKYLSPYLIAKDVVHLPAREDRPGPGIDVRVPLSWQQKRSPAVLGLSPLGPMTHAR